MILCGSWWTTPVRWSPEWNPPFIPFNGGSLFSNLWRFCHCIWFYTAGVDLLWEQSNSLVNILPRLTSPPLTEEHWYRFTKTNKGRYESRHSSFSQAYDQPRQYIKKQRHNSANKGPSSQIYGFSSGHVRMWELDYKESWVPKKKSVLNIHWREWCWSWNSNPLATWCEELIHSKRPWCWKKLKAGGEGDDRWWDGCMASPTQWTWV